MSVDSERLRNTVAYLREVRPIDPAEISDYFDDQPHPAVVRRALRESAFELRLRERADGRFEPVSDEPVPDPAWEPDRYPKRFDDAVAEALLERYGRDWPAGESGYDLRERIRELKENYYRGQAVTYDEERALAYAIYHNPSSYAATGYALAPLARAGLLDRALRIVDVGAGTGGAVAAVEDFLPPETVVEYHAIEPSAAADVFERVADETSRNLRTQIHRESAESVDDDAIGPADLVVFGNVLSELTEPVETVERYLEFLADDGAMVLLAPADLATATGLRAVERAVAPSSASVFAPTLRLWPDESPTDDGWSFDERPPLADPDTQRRLAEAADRDEFPDREIDPSAFRNTAVRFAYAILRPDGRRRTPVRADPKRHAKLADSERHVTNRVDLLAVKLSRNLADDGNPVFRVGDGSQATDHYAVLTEQSTLNEGLETAEYGTVLSFENTLVLWNDDERAYNLVCDAECVVEPVA